MNAGTMQMLLHHYMFPGAYRGPVSEQFDVECRCFLKSHGLLFTTTGGVRWEISDKGRAYVEMLLATPLPVQKWMRP